jgi:3-deoxy-D-manno-octulosonate 8-phosphate phosphatase (KDO 8-P phosphatase)
MATNYKILLNQINAFIFDIDGVLTDGNVLLDNGKYLRTLNAKDSYALQYAAKMGYKIFFISGGSSIEMKQTLENLGVTMVYLESKSKLLVFNKLKIEFNISEENVLYMGDDIPDIPLLSIVGIAACPKDASIDVTRICSYVSPKEGGKGCVRDVIEQTLRVQEKWLLDGAYEW